MRRDIEFDAEGVDPCGGGCTCRTGVPGRLRSSSWPTASRPSRRCTWTTSRRPSPPGLAALVFDNRGPGASDGEPRQEIDPWAQVRDYRHAITYAQTSSRSTPSGRRVGFEPPGAHAGARGDRQAHQVRRRPGAAGHRHGEHPAAGPPGLPEPQPPGHGAGPRRPLPGEPPAMVPVVDPDPLAVSALPTPDSWSGSARPARSAPRPGGTR